jgi:hypothetical protein
MRRSTIEPIEVTGEKPPAREQWETMEKQREEQWETMKNPGGCLRPVVMPEDSRWRYARVAVRRTEFVRRICR